MAVVDLDVWMSPVLTLRTSENDEDQKTKFSMKTINDIIKG